MINFPQNIGTTECLTSLTIVNDYNGSVVENQDGTVSVYIDNGNGPTPLVLSKACCQYLSNSYFFNINEQKCRWSEQPTCNLQDSFKIILNPKGNDGTLFYVEENDSCYLSVDFNYLFKIKCETLNTFINEQTLQLKKTNPNSDELSVLKIQLETQQVLCESYTNQLSEYGSTLSQLSYSIICNSRPVEPSGLAPSAPSPSVLAQSSAPSPSGLAPSAPSPSVLAQSASEPVRVKSVGNSAFGNSSLSVLGQSSAPSPSGLAPSAPSPSVLANTFKYGQLYCLTEPNGLDEWKKILGDIRYNAFLNGDNTSYSCSEVQSIYQKNSVIISDNMFMTRKLTPLIIECDTPINTKTNLINLINNIALLQVECQDEIERLTIIINELQPPQLLSETLSCNSPIDFFENFDVSMSVDVITSANTLESVYSGSLITTIGSGNLYSYLMTNNNSGFYVCGDPTGSETQSNCNPLIINLTGGNDNNVFTCENVTNNLVTSLFDEYTGTSLTSFQNTFPTNAFSSAWRQYHAIITDPVVISKISNQKIKLSIHINHTCGDFCVLVDDISLSKVCTHVDENNIFLTRSPGFELERIIDNKKSWLNNTTLTNRPFVINNNKGGSSIRQTNYDVNDERLVINSKEIDLDISIASAIESDIWCYLIDNSCLGEPLCPDVITSECCNPCLSNCCGDNVDFNSLLSEPLSGITTIEDFEYFLASELIDAKNRQTISTYPTLRALYDRYINSGLYCGNESSKFDYITMNQFASLVGTYWVDIVEQVIPATTIWGSTKIYSNTIFDQQKFKYKSYSSLFCGNPYTGQTILSPINGISGVCNSVSVATTPLYGGTDANMVLLKPVTSYCESVCIAQMNSGSEFIGKVSIVGPSAPNCDIMNDNSINENTLQASVVINYPNVSVTLVGATQPVSYLWDNGATTPTTSLQSGNHTVTIIDGSCNEITVDFMIPEQELSACWYNMQESPEFIMFSLGCGPSSNALSSVTFNVSSFILNDIEQISNTGYSKTITSGTTNPVNWISSSNSIISGCTSGGITGLTYTNFVDLLNEMFIDLGLTSYRAQISLNERVVAGSNSKDGFYIIRPTLDIFEFKTSDTSNTYTYNLKYKNNIITDWNNIPRTYYKADCSNITLVDGEVIE